MRPPGVLLRLASHALNLRVGPAGYGTASVCFPIWERRLGASGAEDRRLDMSPTTGRLPLLRKRGLELEDRRLPQEDMRVYPAKKLRVCLLDT
jgi:hypothetical protein